MLFRNFSPWILALVSLSAATVIASPQMLLYHIMVISVSASIPTVCKKTHYIAKTHIAKLKGMQDC